jgi:hypothetical protein
MQKRTCCYFSVAVLAAMIIACGASSGQAQGVTARPSVPAAIPSQAPTRVATVSAASVKLNVVSVDGPHGKPPGGIRCPLWIDRRDQIVFTAVTLGQTQLSQLQTDWNNFVNAGGLFDASKPLPTGLRRAPGAITSGLKPRPPIYTDIGGTSYFWGPGCSIDLQITNVGNAPVQIPAAGVLVSGTPERNTQQYNLVDRCSLTSPRPQPCHPQLGGGPVECQLYDTQVQLDNTQSNALVTDSPASRAEDAPCPTLTINPNATIELLIDAASHDSLVYSVTPVLSVDTQAGRYLVSLPDLAGSMAFADPAQFACYKLQQSTLLKALDGASVFPTLDPKSGNANSFESWQKADVWCL